MKIKYEDTILNISIWSMCWRIIVFMPCIIYLIFIELPLILISMLFNYLSLMAVCRYQDPEFDNSFQQLTAEYYGPIKEIINWYSKHTIVKIDEKLNKK